MSRVQVELVEQDIYYKFSNDYFHSHISKYKS